MTRLLPVTDFTVRYFDKHHHSPSIRDIAAYLECSTSTAKERVAEAVAAGQLGAHPGKARAIWVIEQ